MASARVNSLSPSDLDRVQLRPGGRSERLRQAVLKAACEELLVSGYEGLSHRAVARRAGVHVATLYRRWPTRPRLMAAVLLSLADELVPVPDTGALASDLWAYLSRVVAMLSDPNLLGAIRSISAAMAEGDESVRAVLAAFWQRRLEGAAAVLDRAFDRGELAERCDGRQIAELLVAPAWLRALVSQQPLDDAFLKGCVKACLKVAGARAFSEDVLAMVAGGQ